MNILYTLLMLLSVIPVRTQADFDSMTQQLRKSISSGESDIRVVFSEGTFHFKEQHVALNGIDRPGTSISFVGNNTRIVSAGVDVKPGSRMKDPLDWCYGYSLPDGSDFDPWSRVYDAAGAIEIVDASRKLCRVRSAELSLPDRKKCSGSYILVTQWFKSSIYPVDHVKGDFIYFIADNLSKVSLVAYNVNNDIVYGGVGAKPRFKVFNLPVKGTLYVDGDIVHVPDGIQSLHIGKSRYFLDLDKCRLKSFEASGIAFLGNATYANGAVLIRVSGVDSKYVSFHDCSFTGIRSNVFSVNKTSNVSISGNTFTNLYAYGVYGREGAENIEISGNSFDNCGLHLNNTYCIICSGGSYHICDNVLRNFGSCGIAVGAWLGDTCDKAPRGTVERNELFYDPEYAAEYRQHTLMDSGAIYIYTLNDRALVQHNYIHDYCGMKDNRGIFCDDGARGFTLKGNVVLRVANSYSIDSRRVNASEDKNGRNNVGNVISDNIVDGPIRFEGNDAQRDCVMGNNWQLPASYTGLPDSRVRNINSPKKMTPVTGPKDRKLRRNPEYKKISKYLE